MIDRVSAQMTKPIKIYSTPMYRRGELDQLVYPEKILATIGLIATMARTEMRRAVMPKKHNGKYERPWMIE